jgi:PIN domain nuclease of toxin-antitoxin system
MIRPVYAQDFVSRGFNNTLAFESGLARKAAFSRKQRDMFGAFL